MKLRDLSVSIADQRICTGLDLTLETGQCWGLLGRNGSGKTTLLHTLAGLHPADGGDILLNGRFLGDLQRREVAQTLGLVFQDAEDAFPASVLETVLLGRHPHLGAWQWESQEDKEIALASLERVDLAHFEGRNVDTLSGGERRRVAIATLLAQAPPLMLLDEPTNHLDLNQQIHVLQLLKDRCNRGHAVLMSLHDVNLALRFCDHLLLIGNGEHQAGPCAEMGRRDILSDLYGYPLTTLSGPHGQVMIPN